MQEVQQGRKSSTLFFHKEAGHTDEAKNEMKLFFDQNDDLFSTPKPTRLMKQLLRLIPNENPTVLGFMAGSGSTIHSVLDLNLEDKQLRQFILVTNNEDNICSDVCYPRINNVINGFKTKKGADFSPLGGNLKYFKTTFVPAKSTDRNKEKLTKQSVEMFCLKENTFESVLDSDNIKIFKNLSVFMCFHWVTMILQKNFLI